jgi:hypothetical protein
MNSKVKVLGDANGVVIHQSQNNPEYGYVRVEQTRTVVDDNGFLRRKAVSALIQATVADLQASGFYAGQELPGNVVIIESLEPFNKKYPERDHKVAGETGIICTVEGNPIFRKTIYTTASNAEDVTVKHDNIEELRIAYAKQASASTTSAVNTPNVDFEDL